MGVALRSDLRQIINTYPYTAAPATSHCWGMKFFDQRLFPQFEFSFLIVRFRDKKTGGPTAEYAYAFDNADQGQAIFDEMVASGHPYGEVLHPKVIKTGIPYTPLH